MKGFCRNCQKVTPWLQTATTRHHGYIWLTVHWRVLLFISYKRNEITWCCSCTHLVPTGKHDPVTDEREAVPHVTSISKWFSLSWAFLNTPCVQCDAIHGGRLERSQGQVEIWLIAVGLCLWRSSIFRDISGCSFLIHVSPYWLMLEQGCF